MLTSVMKKDRYEPFEHGIIRLCREIPDPNTYYEMTIELDGLVLFSENAPIYKNLFFDIHENTHLFLKGNIFDKVTIKILDDLGKSRQYLAEFTKLIKRDDIYVLSTALTIDPPIKERFLRSRYEIYTSRESYNQ